VLKRKTGRKRDFFKLLSHASLMVSFLKNAADLVLDLYKHFH
jgi:hypothetical protein